jgi:SNF2 family DNA or RNA helicase
MGSLGSLGSLDSEQLLIASSVQKVRCFQDDASVISCPPTQSSEGTMDSILNELGAVEENESDVQRSVLKEKILKSIRFPRISRDDLNPCEPVTVIGGFPELSKNSQQLMLTELRREVQDLKLLRGRSSLYEVAVIKLRFFQALLCIPDGSDVLENAAVSASTIDIRKVDAFSGIKSINGSNTNRREVNFMSLAAVGREPGHSMSASSKYSQNGGYGGSNLGLHDLNLHIHGKDRITQKWKIDNDAIDELNSEAMNSKVHHRSSSEYDAMPPREDLKAVKNGVSSDTELLQSPKTSIPNFVSNKDLNPDNYSPHNTSEHQGQTGLAEKRKVVKVKEEIYPETAGENPMEERLIKKTRRESSSKKIVKSQESKQVLTVRDGEKMKSVTCPICGNELAVHQQSAAAVLDRHIDRCTRRMETERSQSGRRISSATDFVRGEVMDLACASDEEEAEVSFTKRKIRTHSKSGAGSIRSIYLESDDESVNKSESEVEDAREDYVPGCNEDISESDVDSAADTDDEGPSREPKSKNRGSKKVAASIPGKGVKRKKGQVLPVISEPTLRKKDKRMAEKLLREGRSGRGVNRKGIIEEDKAEVFDDWEDDFYLERLELRGIGEFDEIRPRSPRTVIKEENSDTHSDVENIHAEAVSDGSVSSSKLHQGYIEIDEVLDIDKHTWATLFEYQKEGVRWLFSLYESGVGGILGDEMGLGKTAQLCCHFGSLSRKQRKLRKKNGIFLVVCPATVLQHWLKEFHRWVPAIRCVIMHSISRTGAEVQQLAESGVSTVYYP